MVSCASKSGDHDPRNQTPHDQKIQKTDFRPLLGRLDPKWHRVFWLDVHIYEAQASLRRA